MVSIKALIAVNFQPFSRYMVDPRVAGYRMKPEMTTFKSLKPLMMIMTRGNPQVNRL